MEALPCHVLLERSGPATPSGVDQDGVRLFSKCRNELLRLPAFLDHYRRLGVRQFFFVDNDSSDGTLGYLAEQPDVVVFSTDGAFRQARGGTDWLNAMLRRFGTGHWCVTVDVDELLRYPGCDTFGLEAFTEHLDARGSQAVACLLLDMYPAEPLGQTIYEPGTDLLDAAPYFDSGPYKRLAHGQCPGFMTYGGVRERVFYPESWNQSLRRRLHVKLYHRLLLSIPGLRDLPPIRERRPRFPPLLTKVPLVRWEADTEYLNVNHFVSDRVVAPERGVLLHFKLLHDFHDRAVEEMQRGQYYDGAAEFHRYVARLRRDPALSLLGPPSVRFEDDRQIERLGLMNDSADWADARRRLAAA